MKRYEADYYRAEEVRDGDEKKISYKYIASTTFFYYEESGIPVATAAFLNAPERCKGASRLSLRRL